MRHEKVAGLCPRDINRRAVKEEAHSLFFFFQRRLWSFNKLFCSYAGPERLERKRSDGEKMGPTS